MKTNLTKGLLMTALITGSVICGSAAAFAEENVGEFSLDTMIVTAQRHEKKDIDIAASTEVFDQNKLEATGATNLYEALQYAAGMEIQQYGPSGSSMGNMTSKVVIRGNGNGTLVLVNGVPINIRGTYDLNDFPVENVERVEIIRGGGAVMYGSDATGGVINIITKETRANYIKAGLGNRGQQQYSGSFQAGNFGFGYKYSKLGKINNVTNDGKNWQGPENNNFDLSYKFNDRLSLSASHNESNYDYITTQGKISKMGDTPANDANQKIKRNDIQLTYNDDNGWKTTVYYIDRQREKNSSLLDGRFYSWEDEKSYNYGLDAQKLWHINDDTLLFGANYQSENFKLDKKDQKYKNNIPNGDVTIESIGSQNRNNYSVYTQYDKKLGDKNSLVLAARETWTSGAPNDVNFSNFSGQVQFIHKLNENESLYASVGQSFKMPALYQIYKTDKNGNGADNLKSQKGIHYEMGWKKSLDDNHNMKVALFHYKVDDNITATLSSKTNEFTYKNENIRNTGIEAEYAYTVSKGFGYSVNASYGNPQVESVDKGVNSGWKQDYSRFDFKAAITYRMDKWRSALSSSYVAGRHVDDESFKPYLMMNLNADYAADSNNSFFVSLNNILDRKDISYKSSSSDYYVTPFTFMVGYKYSF